MPSKTKTFVRNLLGASGRCLLLGCLLASAGCGSGTQSSSENVASQQDFARIDWGTTLLAGGHVGLGQFPAKFSFDVTAAPSCANDFVAFNTSLNGVPGAGGTANVIAYNNLYSTQGGSGGLCNNTGPTVDWSYYTGGGSVTSSVALSLDGSKVAFVEDSGDGATLRIVKWVAGQGTAPGAPHLVDQDISTQAWSTCTPGNSCVASIAFADSTDDTTSAPFVDYFNDVIYVGDSSGLLHKFTGVFNGTPAEVVTGAWPISVDEGTTLTSPVYDSVSGNIYVGDNSGILSYVRDTNSNKGTCATGSVPCLGAQIVEVGGPGSGGALVDGPIVDGSNGKIYAVNGTDINNNGTIVQTNPDFTSVASFKIGSTGGTAPLYGGAFDNTFFNSVAGAIAGHMYVCGKDPATADSPALYQLSFNAAGVLTSVGTPLTGITSGTGEACSPVTEFFNANAETPTDWIFFSVGNLVSTTSAVIPAGGCKTGGHGCVLSINVTTPASPWTSAVATSAAPLPTNAGGSSSGIIVDNGTSSTTNQTSDIYFSLGANSAGTGPGLPSCNTTAAVGCAVKLTQLALN